MFFIQAFGWAATVCCDWANFYNPTKSITKGLGQTACKEENLNP